MEEKTLKAIKKVRNKHFDNVYFYANLKTGDRYVEDNTILPEELTANGADLLLALYNGQWVASEDVGKMVNFYERIMQGTREPIYMDELVTYIHMKDCRGKKRLFILVCFLELDDKGIIVSYVGKLRVLKTKEIEEREVLSQFSNDKNPAIFIKRIAEFQAADPLRKYAYIQFDVRNFRYINENYGMEVGDQVLQYINDTLKVLCDDKHLFCRMTSDLYEIVTYYNSKDEILEFIELLDGRLHRCGDVRFNMSYGIKIVDGTDVRYRKSGDEAGLARVYAKKSIRSKVAFFEEGLLEDVVKSGEIEEREDDALQNEEFKVYLQPKYIYDGLHAKIIGAEALVRWIDQNGIVKSPAEFIPVFEQNGFILELDQYMWESVCKILRGWIDAGKKPIPISVNVSRSYLHKYNVVEYIKKLVEKYQIPMELLQIEVTETAESPETLKYTKQFKQAGFTLLMDDFGSGYSSLSMLKDSPFDILKMDRSFIVECLNDEHGKKLVSHVVAMSKDLGLDLVAEGVETKEVVDFLHEKGCDVSQGFYFSRPVSVEEFQRIWIDE